MKIFHTENGKEVVYVQMNDIMHLNHTDMLIPASIYTKVFTGITIVDDSNRFDFVKFDEEHEVKFFKDLDFVIDYNQYKDLTDEQLDEECKKIVTEMNQIAEQWNGMKEEERRKNFNMLEKHENLEYMLKFITEIYDIKHWNRTMPFPDFVDVPQKPKNRFSFFRRKKDVK